MIEKGYILNNFDVFSLDISFITRIIMIKCYYLTPLIILLYVVFFIYNLNLKLQCSMPFQVKTFIISYLKNTVLMYSFNVKIHKHLQTNLSVCLLYYLVQLFYTTTILFFYFYFNLLFKLTMEVLKQNFLQFEEGKSFRPHLNLQTYT